MSKYFYHGVTGSFVSIPLVLEILKTGGLKCKSLFGKEPRGYNGLNYVSVCKKYPPEDYKSTTMDNAFYTFVQDNFCFIISNEIDAIKTTPAGKIKWNLYSDSMLTDKRNRISDMFDEWQVYKEIPLSAIIGIAIPVQCLAPTLKDFPSDCNTIKSFRKLLELANELGLDIVDTNQRGFVEEYERKKQEASVKIYQISKKLEQVINRE